MKKRSAILGILVLLAAVGGAFFFLHKSVSFYRLPASALPRDNYWFRSDPVQRRLFYRTRDTEEWLDKLPNHQGGYFVLRGSRRIEITPRDAKACGLYSFVFFRSFDKNRPIVFTLYRRRAKSEEILFQRRNRQAAFPFFSEPALRKGDRLVFEFAGNGIVYFSRPLFYRPTALPEREYVFLIAPDTFRGDLVGKQADGVKLTPNLELFQEESATFARTIAPSSWTVPSFASLFTALTPHRHGVGMGQALDPSIPTLTSRLAERFITFGYHGGLGLQSHWGFARDFDHYQDYPPAGPFNPQGGRAVFAKAIELVQTAAFPRTFIFLHTYQVHEPYTPADEFRRKRAPALPFRSLGAFNSMEPEKTFLFADDELRRASQALYEAEAMAFDDAFGWFVAELRRLGIYDRSLIVFTSDHGEEFFEHGGWAHAHSLYNELVRVPLIIKFPRQEHAGKRLDCLAGLVDVLPTLLDYYRLPPQAEGTVDGQSLLPALAGKAPPRLLLSDIASCRYNGHFSPKFALFFHDAKLIFNYPAGRGDDPFFAAFGSPPSRPALEWFDLGKDPGELRPLQAVQSTGATELIGEMRRVKKEIDRILKAVGDPSGAMDDETRGILRSLGYIR